MFSQYNAINSYNAHNNKLITDRLKAQLIEAETVISDNCQTIARLKNNNRILENSVRTLLDKINEVERIEFNQKVDNLVKINEMMVRNSAPSTSPTLGNREYGNA